MKYVIMCECFLHLWGLTTCSSSDLNAVLVMAELDSCNGIIQHKVIIISIFVSGWFFSMSSSLCGYRVLESWDPGI